MRAIRLSPTVRTMSGASALTTLGTLPVFLLGTQAVFIRVDLGFGATGLGVAVSAFFASAAATAMLAGGVLDRLGRRGGTLLAGTLAASGGLGTALVARSWPVLVALMVVLGAANAACQVTSNLTLARAVPPHRRGLGFGIKQAAIPLSIVVAGLAVPLVAATAGWRWTFGATGSFGLVALVAGLRQPGTERTPQERATALDRPPMSALLAIMAAIALASASANSFGTFLASWSFEVGLSPSQAGVLMAVGSALNIAVRISSGHWADLRHGRNLPVVAAQMVVGGLSLAALAVDSPWAVVPAALLAFALGWSWPGLLLYAVVRVSRDAPGLATGVVQAGAFVGGAAGPVVFGAVVGALGYRAAWLGTGLLFLIAALLILWGRRLFIADLDARPPVTPLEYGGGRGTPARTTATPPLNPESS